MLLACSDEGGESGANAPTDDAVALALSDAPDPDLDRADDPRLDREQPPDSVSGDINTDPEGHLEVDGESDQGTSDSTEVDTAVADTREADTDVTADLDVDATGDRLDITTDPDAIADADPDADPRLGVPFGLWGLNGYHSVSGLGDVAERLNLTVFQAASANPTWTVGTFLPMAREAGVSVTLRMSGGHSAYTTDSNFDIDKWKAQIAPWKDSGITEFIDDGTIIGHMILDDIGNWSYDHGGIDPTGDELDEMARYSKEIMPGLMTFVRQRATRVPAPTPGQYAHLDACVNQYRVLEGDVTEYATAQREAALTLNLGIINGLNLCDGGDGSSEQQGWRGTGFWAMSADEITTYGDALLVDGLGMFLSWEYDAEEVWPDGTVGANYFNSNEIQAALAALGERVAARPFVELLKP